MKKALLFLALICLPHLALAGTIPLTGTIKLPNGNIFNGNLRLILSYAAGQDSCSNTILLSTAVTYRVANGALPANAVIVGNDCIAPKNTWYTAQYLSSTGALIAQNNFYIQGSSFNLGTATPTPVTTNNLSFDISSAFGCPCTTGGVIFASNGTTLTSSPVLIWNPSTEFLDIVGTTSRVGMILNDTTGAGFTLDSNAGLAVVAGAGTSAAFPLTVSTGVGTGLMTIDGTGAMTLLQKPLGLGSGGTGKANNTWLTTYMIYADSTTSMTEAKITSPVVASVSFNPVNGTLTAVTNGASDSPAFFASTNSTSGQSDGVAIQAGTNSSDWGLQILSENGSNTLFQVNGDGSMKWGLTPSSASVAANFSANRKLAIVINGTTFYLPLATVSW